MTFEQTLQDVLEFQRTTFPESTPVSKLHHLNKEVQELIEELTGNPVHLIERTIIVIDQSKVEMEFADCFLLLMGAAGIYGLTAEDILRVIQKKLEINRKRKWGKPDENGVVLHIKEEHE